MDRKHFVRFSLLWSLVWLFLCACATVKEGGYGDLGPDQSALIITRVKTLQDTISGTIDIFIDGRLERSLAKNEKVRIIIPNGEHSLYAKSRLLESTVLVLNARSAVITLETAFALGYINLAKTDETSLALLWGNAPSGSKALDTAISQAWKELNARLAPKTKTALVNISREETELTAYVVEELAVFLVNKGNLTMVGWKSLDLIKAEQNFQSAGDVSDDSVVSLGRLLGAETVIACSVTGTGNLRRLRVKALNVKTGEIEFLNSYNVR
jgi:hypothetical protein